MRLINDDQLLDLEHGQTVTITWSGGNGPHEYRINQEGDGGTYAVPTWAFTPESPLWRYNRITFVGIEQFHTRVEVPS